MLDSIIKICMIGRMRWHTLLQQFKRPQAICIDLDGTLANSVSVLSAVYHAFLASFGHAGSDEEFRSLMGPSLVEIVRRLKVAYTLEQDEEALIAHYHSLVLLSYRNEVFPFPGAQAFLALAKEYQIPLAIVSSANGSIVSEFLLQHRLDGYFSLIVTPEHHSQSKPNPYLYLRALQQLGKKPKEVWAVEDSEAGLTASLEAGIPTIAFGSHHSHNDRYPIVQRWEQLTTLLQILHDFEALSAKQVVEAPSNESYPLEVEKQVAKIWNAESRKRALFDGELFSIDKVESERLVGNFASYRYYLAQQQIPTIGIRPLSISGIVRAQDCYLVGRRASTVTQYPGCYELVPSGGVDSGALKGHELNLKDQWLKEFEEETSFRKQDIASWGEALLVWDHQSDSFEWIQEVVLAPECLNRKASTIEYDNLEWVAVDQLDEWIAQHEGQFVPLSLALLQLASF